MISLAFIVLLLSSASLYENILTIKLKSDIKVYGIKLIDVE